MKLNLGCGAKPLKGYINIDAPLTEASDPTIKANMYSKIEDLDYKPETVEAVKMEAVFEHFPRHKALFLLKKIYKWLKIGGWVHIVVPDLLATVDKISKTNDRSLRMFYFRHIFGPHTLQYGIHYDGFTVEKLEYTFSRVGFNEFKSTRKGRWPSINFTAWKKEPLMDEKTTISNIHEMLKMYAKGRKSDYLINNWLKQCGGLI